MVFHMDTRFEKEEIKYSGPRKIYARFSPEFGLCRSFRKFLSESTTTWLVNDNKNTFFPWLYPTYWSNASLSKTRREDSDDSFFYFGQNNTMVLLLAPISILLKSIRQPSQFVIPAQGWRVDEFELVNPQNTGSRIYINEINSTTRQPDNPSTRPRNARQG